MSEKNETVLDQVRSGKPNTANPTQVKPDFTPPPQKPDLSPPVQKPDTDNS
jgi:hypothetical protein